jgi:hypothetical protein
MKIYITVTHVVSVFLLLLIIFLYGYDFYQQCYVNLEQEYYIFMNYSDHHSHLEMGKKYHYGSDIVEQNYEKAFQLYNLAVENGDYVAYIYMGQLFMDTNNKEKAVEIYHKAIEKGYFQCFINLGDIYFYEKEFMDIELAEQYYKAAIQHSTFYDAKVLAKDKLLTLYQERRDLFYQRNEEEILDIDTINKYGIGELDNIDEIIYEERDVPGFKIEVDEVDNKTYLQKEIRKNNHQNVHDHVVSNTVKKSLLKLKEKTEMEKDLSTTLIEIRKFIESEKDKEKRKIGLNVLDHIEQSEITYKDTGLKEVDVLCLIWNRIHNNCNEKNKKELKKALFVRLLECIEEDENVCASGIFSRLIDTLNYTDAESIVKIIPKYVLNRELMDKAVKIKKDFIEEKNIEEINEENIEEFKNELITSFKKDYIDTEIISEDILFLEINKWINYI